MRTSERHIEPSVPGLRDVTPLLLRAIETSLDWSTSRLSEAERSLAAIAGARVDCDHGAGERWARLIVQDRAVLALSTMIPFAMVRTPCDSGLFAVIDHHRILSIAVSDWEQRALAADPELLSRAFARGWSPEVNPRAFSAAQLWWMTV